MCIRDRVGPTPTICAAVTETPEPPLAAPVAPPAGALAQPVPVLLPGRWIVVGACVLAALAAAALVLAWNTQQRVKSLEAELVKRQQDSGAQATEARTLARQASSPRARPRPSWRCWKPVWPKPPCNAASWKS